MAQAAEWPALPYEEWRATRETLHMYAQVLGKLRLELSPFEPEWANVPLYVTARGLTTSPMPVGLRTVDAELDLIDHVLVIRTNDGGVHRRPLGGAVADFYDGVMAALKRLGMDVRISVLPSEVADPIPFPNDRVHTTYDAAHAAQFFRVLSMVDLVTKEHHAGFRGRTTPVHFFWGSFDLALARYTGKAVEPRANAGLIERIGGDAETVCAGWWPGDERFPFPAFYSYAYPAPAGCETISIQPGSAGWNSDLKEFVLRYDVARAEPDPRRAILDFYESAYTGYEPLLGLDPALVRVRAPGRAVSQIL